MYTLYPGGKIPPREFDTVQAAVVHARLFCDARTQDSWPASFVCIGDESGRMIALVCEDNYGMHVHKLPGWPAGIDVE